MAAVDCAAGAGLTIIRQRANSPVAFTIGSILAVTAAFFFD
jgi:hypothetical protein